MTLTALLTAFANNILPILLIGGAGFLIGKKLIVDSRTLGRVVFYLFSPLLILNLLLKNELNFQSAILTMAYTATVILVMCALAFLFGKLFQLERPLLLAVLLTVSFGNTGNYGLPLIKLAFGDDALTYASLYFVTTTILFNTLGVVIASLGHMDLKAALFGLFRVPTIYAVILAGLLNGLHLELPGPLNSAVEIAANGSIPVMLVVLGLELSRVQWSRSFRALGLGVFLRLIVSPLIGLLLAIPFGLTSSAKQGTVPQTGMPAAVLNTVVATEYRLEPALVTAMVFLGTLLSPLTLTPLLVYLGGK
jgi:predicted permease